MSKPEIEALLERVKAATGPDRELDAAICIALQYGGPNSDGACNVRTDPEWGDDNDLLFEIGSEPCCNPIPALTASIDAALALVGRMLSGRWAEILRTAMDDLWASTVGSNMPMELLPRFVIAALLTALEAQP